MACQIPLEQALQNIFTVERTDATGLEKLGGATYIHWLCKELHGSPSDGVERSTVRQLLDVSKRLWNRCLHDAKGGGGGARATSPLGAAVRLLALTAMSVALQSAELRLFGDADEKRRCAANLCKLAHDFGAELDDAPSAERCCALACALLHGMPPDHRTIFLRANVLCARARVALFAESREALGGLLAEIARVTADPALADPLQHAELANMLIQIARATACGLAPSSVERAALLIDVLECALGVCTVGLALCTDGAESAAPCAELTRVQASARLFQAVLWTDMPDDATNMSRALNHLLDLPIAKQREPLVQLCISKVLSRLGRTADATHKTLEVVSECDDFDTCFAAIQLLERDGQHEARAEALRSLATRGLHRGDVRRWSTIVKERLLVLHGALRDSDRAFAHLDEAMGAHRQGEHVLSSEVMAFIYSYLYHEFSCLYESGVNLELAATFAARAAEWAADKTSKRLQALRMASWAHLKLNQPAQALAFARKAVTEDPASPKNNFLFVHAAAALGADGADASLDEALRALDSLLETTNYDASCLEVLSSSALEEGHTQLAAAMLSRWLHRGPMAAADGKLLPCLQQLYRVQLGGRDVAALELDEVQVMAGHVRVTDQRLGTFGAEAAHGAEEDVWWAAALAWNLALRARALGAHQLSIELLQVALHLADRLQSGARARQLSLDCHELMACAMCTHLDAALQHQDQPANAEQIARGALQTRAHAQGALRLLDALVAEEAPVEAPASPEEAYAAAERARLRTTIRQRMQLIAIEMEVFAHAFPAHGAPPAPTTAQLSARIEEAVASALLLPEQLEHIAQRALSLEPRAHGIHTVAALGYRRACEAYVEAIELGELAPAGGAQPFTDRFVRLCVSVQHLSERLSEADACLDADLRAKFCTMLALAEKRPAARPASWPELLEWLVDRAERWATRALRTDRLQSAEAWMSCAINMQTALLASAPAARRDAHEQLLREVLQPRYDKLLARRAAAGSTDQISFISPLKPGSAQLMDVITSM